MPRSIFAASLATLTLSLLTQSAHAEWQRDGDTLAWVDQGKTVWRFSYDQRRGKPFFDPVSIAGTQLTNFRPEDHPWHYGLWFSWKYINGANYWEEDRSSGKAQGATRWDAPTIDARADGSATIRMQLNYVHPSGRVDLKETRVIEVSAPDTKGSYTIDWDATFVAGPEGAVLDRTPMPGEPDGKFNGGYAGLSARLAAAPLAMAVVTPDGAVARYENDRARPAVPIVGTNFTREGRPVGSLAIWSNPDNFAGAAPWYVINAAEGMRFVCAAVLAPKVRKLDPAGEWRLQYRVAVQAEPLTPEGLADKAADWSHARVMRSSATEWSDVPAKQSDVRLLRQFFDGPTATLSGLELHVTTLAAGETSHAPHRHPNEELVIVKEGTVEVLVNGEIRRVGPGSVIFNASNELHALRNVGDGPATYHIINWRVPEGK